LQTVISYFDVRLFIFLIRFSPSSSYFYILLFWFRVPSLLF